MTWGTLYSKCLKISFKKSANLNGGPCKCIMSFWKLFVSFQLNWYTKSNLSNECIFALSAIGAICEIDLKNRICRDSVEVEKFFRRWFLYSGLNFIYLCYALKSPKSLTWDDCKVFSFLCFYFSKNLNTDEFPSWYTNVIHQMHHIVWKYLKKIRKNGWYYQYNMQ